MKILIGGKVDTKDCKFLLLFSLFVKLLILQKACEPREPPLSGDPTHGNLNRR